MSETGGAGGEDVSLALLKPWRPRAGHAALPEKAPGTDLLTLEVWGVAPSACVPERTKVSHGLSAFREREPMADPFRRRLLGQCK
jgi:hypothetical protein